MLVSGIGMLINWGFPGKYLTKGILAILMIGVIEMIMGRTRRGQGKEPVTLGMWAAFVILLILILLIGFGVF
ncbi:DUF1516 family protein [Paenibacillus larvae]|nr:DUF1516 family protein [Paenibacillus larvae]